MKTLPVLLGLGVLSSPTLAQHGDGAAFLRMGASCRVILYGQAQGGQCNVLLERGSTDIFIKAGPSTYRITRAGPESQARGVATFYQVAPRGQEDRLIGTVIANGSCWIGDGIRVCAE
jgi:hypothetical protein